MHNILFYISEILLIFSVRKVLSNENSKLLFVQILFRHGDRAPIELYPNDPNPESFWIEGLGKLTLLGRKQHYALGKYLRKRYENFTTSSPNEVNVISSDCDRCIRSAESNLASFFAPNSAWKFEKDLDWQPISVFYIPKEEDKYLEVSSFCPRAFQEQERVLKSPEGQAFIAKHKEMFKNLTINSGTLITNWTTATYLHDVLFIEKKYNLTVPSWTIPYWNELSEVADLTFYWNFNSPLLHRLRAGPFLERLISLMKSKLSGDIPSQKFQIYSAHDNNVAVVLNALNLFNMKQPPYCATLLFELYERTDGVNTLRILFLNSTHPEFEIPQPHVLVLEGCTEFCPLDYFINYTKPLIPTDWDKECQLKKTFFQKFKERNSSIAFFVVGLVVPISVFSIFSIWRFYSRKRDRYSYHLMPLN